MTDARRQMDTLVNARDRATERMEDGTMPEWLRAEWNLDADALRFFAKHCEEHAGAASKAACFQAGFLAALEIAADPHIWRGPLRVA